MKCDSSWLGYRCERPETHTSVRSDGSSSSEMAHVNRTYGWWIDAPTSSSSEATHE